MKLYIYFIVTLYISILFNFTCAQKYQYRSEAQRRLQAYQNYWLKLLNARSGNRAYNTNPRTTTTPRTTSTTTTTTKRPSSSPSSRLTSIIEKSSGSCGVRSSNYLPHTKKRKSKRQGPQPRRGRIVWDDDDSNGAAPAPRGTFPWMVSLFVLLKNGEALFMCAGTLLTPNLAVTAAHCFTNNEKRTTWFARVGDNYILKPDPDEQTFRVSKIIKHGQFKPLGEKPNGDGRHDIALPTIIGKEGMPHDIALIVLQPHRKAKDLYGNNNQSDGLVEFGRDVRPICTLPQADYPLNKLTQYHCEISGWGMTEYNNSNSYPDSVRAARITVGDVSETFCNYLYKRNVYNTGKFCAGNGVDACQEDSGGPLVCQMENGKYHLVGIVSSGKGCGIYPGLYTDVSRYMDWLAYWVEKESV